MPQAAWLEDIRPAMKSNGRVGSLARGRSGGVGEHVDVLEVDAALLEDLDRVQQAAGVAVGAPTASST